MFRRNLRISRGEFCLAASWEFLGGTWELLGGLPGERNLGISGVELRGGNLVFSGTIFVFVSLVLS